MKSVRLPCLKLITLFWIGRVQGFRVFRICCCVFAIPSKTLFVKLGFSVSRQRLCLFKNLNALFLVDRCPLNLLWFFLQSMLMIHVFNALFIWQYFKAVYINSGTRLRTQRVEQVLLHRRQVDFVMTFLPVDAYVMINVSVIEGHNAYDRHLSTTFSR